MTSIDKVLLAIRLANHDELKRVVAAAQSRSAELQELRSADVAEGGVYRTSGIRPKYLNSIEGIVENIRRDRADLRITDLTALRRLTGTKYGPRTLCDEWVLRGIPLSALMRA